MGANGLRRGRTLAKNLLTGAIVVAGALSTAAIAASEHVLEATAAPRAAIDLEANVERHRFVRFATTDLRDRLRLNLFDDVAIDARRVRIHENDLGGWVWEGALADGKGAVFLSRVGNVLLGNVWSDGTLYEIRYTGDSDRHVVTEVNVEGFDPEGCTTRHDVFESELGDIAQGAEDRAADPAGVIDLVVLYTPLARERQGGKEGIEALIHMAIGVSNAANDDSDVNPRFSPTYIGEIDYLEAAVESPDDEDADVFRDRNRLRDPADGFMDDAHTLRDRYCGDIVHVVTGSGGGWCGAAYIMQTPNDATHEDRGFAITKDSCAVGGLTFAHEMGHTLGAQHDWYVDDSSDPWVYSHGHLRSGEWRTIMSYSSFCNDRGESCGRIPRWSNPNRFWDGQPVGVAEGTDDTCVAESLAAGTGCDAENYRVINNNASTVANFRRRDECGSSNSRNVWMKDTWEDTGAEPDLFTAGQKMWKSPYIWVRNDFDGTGEFQHQHQNPEFGTTNYVYVKLHNDFDVQASGQLKLYYAKASTGLTWPGDWTEFASLAVNNIAANATLLQPAAWDPPGTGHYCLIARWDEPNNPPDPMTNPEGSIVKNNVRNNNNIVWRNLNVIDVEPNTPFASQDLDVKSTSPTGAPLDLRIELPNDVPNLLGAGGRLWLDMGDALAIWRAGGGRGSNVRLTTLPGFGEVVEILPSSSGQATINQLALPPSREFSMNFIVEAPVVPIPPGFPTDLQDEPNDRPQPDDPTQIIPDQLAPHFAVDLVQFENGEEIGGVGYEIRVQPTSTGAGQVPNGASIPGVPLRVDRTAATVELSWSASCQTMDRDYAVYEGQLGDFVSHVPAACLTGGATSASLDTPEGSRYFLIVPTDGAADGSYGFDSTGAERPVSNAACRLQIPTTCP